MGTIARKNDNISWTIFNRKKAISEKQTTSVALLPPFPIFHLLVHRRPSHQRWERTRGIVMDPKAFDIANVTPEARGVFPLTLFTIRCLEFGVMIDATGESEFPGDYRNGFDFGW